MIISLRNNARLLRKKNMFRRESSFLNAKKELYKAASGKIEIRKAAPDELKKVRLQIAQNRRTSRRDFIIIISITIPLLFLIGKFALNSFHRGAFNPYAFEKESLESQLNKKKKTYLFYIEDGDRYLSEKHWKNAIFQYKAAIHLFPREFDARYRLALAYSYSCMNTESNCIKGRQLTNLLLKDFPDNNDLIKLGTVFSEISSPESTPPTHAAPRSK